MYNLTQLSPKVFYLFFLYDCNCSEKISSDTLEKNKARNCLLKDGTFYLAAPTAIKAYYVSLHYRATITWQSSQEFLSLFALLSFRRFALFQGRLFVLYIYLHFSFLFVYFAKALSVSWYIFQSSLIFIQWSSVHAGVFAWSFVLHIWNAGLHCVCHWLIRNIYDDLYRDIFYEHRRTKAYCKNLRQG